jgi:ABC-type oligopeptide transport system substrate-binding subunit
MDGLLAGARRKIDVAERAQDYAEAQRILVRDVPALPIWYERAYGGLSERVAGPERTIDLTSPGYAWDVDRWQLLRP